MITQLYKEQLFPNKQIKCTYPGKKIMKHQYSLFSISNMHVDRQNKFHSGSSFMKIFHSNSCHMCITFEKEKYVQKEIIISHIIEAS